MEPLSSIRQIILIPLSLSLLNYLFSSRRQERRNQQGANLVDSSSSSSVPFKKTIYLICSYKEERSLNAVDLLIGRGFCFIDGVVYDTLNEDNYIKSIFFILFSQRIFEYNHHQREKRFDSNVEFLIRTKATHDNGHRFFQRS